MGSYMEDLKLDDKELYENVYLKFDIRKMDWVIKRDKYFVMCLRRALWDPAERPRLLENYGVRICFMGTNADDATLSVDGEIVYKDKDN